MTSNTTLNSYTHSRLNIVVALPCEARPFIDHLSLKKRQGHAFSLYANQHHTIHLIVSGVGKVNAAAATAYLHHASGHEPHTVYLNVGIAGSADVPEGACCFAHKITDQALQKAYYPYCYKQLHLPSIDLLTVDHPQTQPIPQVMVDMEASAFFHTANRFVPQEQLHVLKVISDPLTVEATGLKPKAVTTLIEAQWPAIESSVFYLLALSEQEYAYSAIPPVFNDFIAQWHFTQYQQHDLLALLRRWRVCLPDQDPYQHSQPASSAQHVLICLKKELNSL